MLTPLNQPPNPNQGYLEGFANVYLNFANTLRKATLKVRPRIKLDSRDDGRLAEQGLTTGSSAFGC